MTIRTPSIRWTLALAVAVVAGAAAVVALQDEGGGPQLEKLTLPPGFSIEVYAAGVDNARQMSLSPNGTLFVSTRRAGNVYAVLDDDRDQKADRVLTLDSDLNMPNGVAFRDGALYVAEGQPRAALRRHRGEPRDAAGAGGGERRVPDRPRARLEVHRVRSGRTPLRAGRRAVQRCATTRPRRPSTPPSTA